MNGRKAKRLRREAERQTIQYPKLKYTRKHNRSLMLVSCTRARYKELKRESNQNK